MQAHYGNSVVTVNAWTIGNPLQSGSASGSGYDKLTAAMSGLVIDGNKIFDHCENDELSKKILRDLKKRKNKHQPSDQTRR